MITPDDFQFIDPTADVRLFRGDPDEWAPAAAPGPAGRETRATRVYRRLWRLGLFDRLIGLRTGTLTVLLYHRIAHPEEVARSGFADNVSATPAQFDEQVRFLASRFDLIPASLLADWRRGRAELPPRAALITFDDGYRDNLETALPILRRHDAPALLCLAVDCIGSDRPFFWDAAGYCFGRSARATATLPLLGERRIDRPADRRRVLREWIQAAKRLPDGDKRAALAGLPAALGVTVPADAFAGTHLSWAEVERLRAGGVEIGAHTLSHPILSRIPADRAWREIADSRSALEQRLGAPVRCFAYPNGSPADFGDLHAGMVDRAGFDIAFTTSEGPCRQSAARADPLRIRRINVTTADTLPRFAAKVSGLARAPARIAALLHPAGVLRGSGR